jgi:perosamine synthetase
MFEKISSKIRSLFGDAYIPLHTPHFGEKEKAYVLDAIDSTFVSSVGPYVQSFEERMALLTGARYAVAMVNGTASLHLALVAMGVTPADEVITQPLTFVATVNAIRHAGAQPVFVDVDPDTMGMSPASLEEFLDAQTEMREGACHNKTTGKRIAACVPMHTFGFPLRIDEVIAVCERFRIPVVEDAAESLGSYYKGRHTGTFGLAGTFSFNGNKTITCGGGGAIVTNDRNLAVKMKHLSTTAKIPHPWQFVHDEVAYNYRMPNLNAALACAQLERLEGFLENKRELAEEYRRFFSGLDVGFVWEIEGAKANHWLNAILLKDAAEKNAFLEYTNSRDIMTRPIWRLANKLTMFSECQASGLPNAEWLEDRVVNIPSSVRYG